MRYDTKERVAYVMEDANCDKKTAAVWLKHNKGALGQSVIDARADVQMRSINGKPVEGGLLNAYVKEWQ